MLSEEEKKEMIQDGQSLNRRNDFRFAQKILPDNFNLDSYLIFLNSIQQIFGPFKLSKLPTLTKFNKL